MGKRSQAKMKWLTMSQRTSRGDAKTGARWLVLHQPKAPAKKA